MYNYYYSTFPIRSVEHMPKVDLGSKVEPSALQHGAEYTIIGIIKINNKIF